jgi:hypothetical protein
VEAEEHDRCLSRSAVEMGAGARFDEGFVEPAGGYDVGSADALLPLVVDLPH